MNDDDIYAFSTPPRGAPAAPAPAAPAWPPPRRLWPWLLGALVLVLALALVVGAVAVVDTLAEAAGDGVHVVLDGMAWEPGAAVLAAIVGGGLALVCAVMMGVLMLLLTLLLVLPLGIAAVLLVAGLGLGVALLALAGVAAVVLSPLWLFVLLLWWMLRSKTSAPAATMST